MRMDALRFACLLLIAVSIGCFALKPSGHRPPETPRMSPERLVDDDPPPKLHAPPMPTVPARPTAASKNAPLRPLADRAAERERRLESYQVRLRRRERIKGKLSPTEIVLLKYRRSPFSVHLKWLGEEANGREIIYVKDRYDDKVQILTGQGDLLLPGNRLSFAPNSAVVRSKFRYDLGDVGLAGAVNRFTTALDAVERNQANAGTLKHLGEQARPEFPKPLEAVEHSIPAGYDPLLPQGGTRLFFFDDATGLPLLVVTVDDKKQEVECYCFDRLQTPIALDDADFDPALLWPLKKNPE